MRCARIVGRLIAVLLILFGCVRIGVAADEPKWTEANGTKLLTHEIARGGVKPDPHAWKDIVGRSVIVQGLAWGAFEKGHGPYVIMNGSVIYVDSTKFPAISLQGKSIEIKGKLIVRHHRAAKAGEAGFSRRTRVYLIQSTEFTILSRVSWPWMRLADRVKSN